jgi:flagellar basal body-associated protein FliL
MEDPQNRNKKGKSVWVPLVAIAAVIGVGVVGLTRGCSYASAPTPAETNGQPVREDPDV